MFGAWGEASKDVHSLVETLAECRLRSQALSRGRVEGEEVKSVLVGQIRRCLSVSVIRATTSCLLDRLHQVGRGVAGANGRREASRWQEEVMRADRDSVWSARVGRQTTTRGLFFKN